MRWYEGSIAEAVALSKQKNAIFVVYVEGDNDQSTEMAATIDHPEVVSRLSNEINFLAIKLKSGTDNYTHFAQIYYFVPVPSLFFIGRNGTPLEVVCSGVQPDNLATRIDRILSEHHKKTPDGPPSTTSPNIRQQTASLLHAEAVANPTGGAMAALGLAAVLPSNPASVQPPSAASVPPPNAAAVQPPVAAAEHPPSAAMKTHGNAEPSAPPAKIAKTEYEVVCEGDTCVRRPAPHAAGASTSAQGQASAVTPASEEPKQAPIEATASTESAEEKMERAKELIEALRREKADKEKELEKQKELERRTAGQGVAELKKWQAEQEMKNLQEERKREKMENNLARQRILEQIAQDRAERRARDAPPPAPQLAPPQASAANQPPAGDAQSSVRIQFKLPDGSSHSASFEAGGTLASVRRYVADNLQLSSSNFALWTAFPRRELTEADATLRELQLAPSAALLVLPRRAGSAPPVQSFSVVAFITQLLTSLIYDPTLQLYTWLRARLFPPPAVSPRAPTTPTAPPRSPTASPLRRRGNVHRIPGDAPDDDNNTWNGNSTQQM